MLKTVTKKAIKEVVELIKNNGYWSEQVKEYYSNYDYNSMVKLDSKVKAIIKGGL